VRARKSIEGKAAVIWGGLPTHPIYPASETIATSFDIFCNLRWRVALYGRQLDGPQHSGDSMPQSSALLLLVEDDELLHPSLEDALTEGGFEVKLATNGAEGLALLETHKDAIRGLITDINLGRVLMAGTWRGARAS
jgi:hypothetical protein